MWRKALKTDDISIDDDFFEKGGGSLLAADLHLELQRLTDRDLPELLLFEKFDRSHAGQETGSWVADPCQSR